MREEEIEINGNSHKYVMEKYNSSRNIKLKIDKDGKIKVSLPKYVPYLVAKKFVNSNSTWIEKKLDLLKERQNKYYYLGNNIALIKKEHINNKNLKYIFKNDRLIVQLNPSDKYTDDELFFEWLKQKAYEYIPPKVKQLSKKYNLEYNCLQLKNLNSRWGSCSIKKGLSFNIKLMYFNYKIIDYVIIHELCHLKEMNHSNKFWKLVQGIVPDYSTHRKELNKIVL